MNDRDENRARGGHMVAHGAGPEMPASVDGLIQAIREGYALPDRNPSAWLDSVLEELGALHGDIMADKLAANLASSRLTEMEAARDALQRDYQHMCAANEKKQDRIVELSGAIESAQIDRRACVQNNLRIAGELASVTAERVFLAEGMRDILYDMGELPYRIAKAHPAAHSLMRTYLERGEALATACKEG